MSPEETSRSIHLYSVTPILSRINRLPSQSFSALSVGRKINNSVIVVSVLFHTNMALIPRLFRSPSVFDPFSPEIWDPSFFGSGTEAASSLANMQIDWKETPEAHVFKADLPGLKKDEVKVEVEDGRVLQISGERSMEKEDKNDKWHRVERSHGKFLRRFRLPENAKLHAVKAAMENGVLTVTVPKQEVKKPEIKSIEISG